jgi:hypothetical protein
VRKTSCTFFGRNLMSVVKSIRVSGGCRHWLQSFVGVWPSEVTALTNSNTLTTFTRSAANLQPRPESLCLPSHCWVERRTWYAEALLHSSGS